MENIKISIVSELAAKQFADKFSMPYLKADFQYWINADDKEMPFEDMSEKYLNNCLNTLMHDRDRSKPHGIIERILREDSSYYKDIINEELYLDFDKLSFEQKKSFIDSMRESIKKLIDTKIIEIKNYIKTI